jgi:crotonobetainyl-CoA:carnitine CoA-transferase CaiB-like acyl-CoA transferase
LTEQALAGIRVVDLSEHVSGPYCTKMLAAFGAEVIKVEPPGRGDCSRRLGPFPGDIPHQERSGAFLYLNTGKKSVTLNPRTATGLGILKDLLRTADILVENSPPGELEKMGLSYAVLHKLHPGLIVTSITGHGQTGPYARYGTASITGYALSGHQYITGEPDREPLQGPGPQPEYQGGLHGFFGTLAALYAREDTGEGQHIDVSVMECMAGFHQFTIIRYTYSGEIKQRTGNRYESNHPITIYPCKDGYVALSASSPMQQELFYALIGQPEILTDPRFLTPLDRLANAAELDALVMPWFRERTKDEIFHTCNQWRVPCAPVTSPGDLIEDPHFKARDFWVETDHPEAGVLTYPGAPYRMSLTPWQTGPAPLLGQHNTEVYCGILSYDAADLIRLREGGII